MEFPEKILKHQVYLQRDTSNYEGKVIISKKKEMENNMSKDGDSVPYRYYLMQQYDATKLRRLEQECSSLFLRCIDFEEGTKENGLRAYDMLYKLYCEKFREVDLEKERFHEAQGLDSPKEIILSKIRKYQSVSVEHQESVNLNRRRSHENKEEVNSTMKILFGTIAIVLVVVYYVTVYFTIIDVDPEDRQSKYKVSKYGSKKKARHID